MTDATVEDTTGTWRRYRFVLWTDLLAPLSAAVVFFGLLIVVYTAALSLAPRLGLTQPQIARMLPGLLRQPGMTQLMTAVSDLLMLFFLWRIARRVADDALIARYRGVGRLLPLLAGIGGVLLAVGTMFGIEALLTHHVVAFHPKSSDAFFAPTGFAQYPIVIATAALIAPFVEEFYFRGVLLSWLKSKIALVPAILVSAALFGLVHLRFVGHPGAEGWLFTGVIALVGLVNAILASTTKSLWPPFCLHAAYNSTLLAAALLPRLLG